MDIKKLITQRVSPLLETNLFFIVVIVGLSFYGFKMITDLKNEQKDLETNNQGLISKVDSLEQDLENTKKNTTELFLSLTDSQTNNATILAEKLQKITGTVNTLEKLTLSDPELLKKYSKVYFLNEHYVPISLTKIEADYLYEPTRNLEIHSDVWPQLKKMITAANKNDGELSIASAYRSFGTQAVLKEGYRLTYGAGTANSFSAEQGYSEHQLGTTVDFTTKALNGNLNGFDKTSEYKWLLENGHKYGFVISYPAENTYYKFEPWHWRFVGVDLAKRIYDEDTYFYDMDQRIIDTYLGNLFD